MQLGPGEVGGLGLEAIQGLAEAVVLEPAVEGRAADAGGAGGLRQGRRGGNVGKGGQLAFGEGGRQGFLCRFVSYCLGGEKKRTDRAVSPCYGRIARLFCDVKAQ